MKLLQELKMAGVEARFDLSAVEQIDHVKVFVSGVLAAQAADQRMFLRVNGLQSGYQSFVVMDGHAHGGEWDTTGFYVGRNGWQLDASVSIEYTISAANLQQKRVGHGMSTFGHGNNNILGYTCNGFLVSDAPIENVQIVTTGGLFTGVAKAYAF